MLSLALVASGTPLFFIHSATDMWTFLLLFSNKLIPISVPFYPFLLPGTFSFLFLGSIHACVCTLVYAQAYLRALKLSFSLPPSFPSSLSSSPLFFPLPSVSLSIHSFWSVFQLGPVYFHLHFSIFTCFVSCDQLNLPQNDLIVFLPSHHLSVLPVFALANGIPFFLSLRKWGYQ